MRTYVIRRLLLMLPTLLLVSLAVFLLTHLIPGDIINLMISQSGGDKFDRPMVERALGLDVPLMHQYGRWMGFITNADGRFDGLFQGNLGVSWWYGESTKDIINTKWPVTLELGLMALTVSQLIALPIGIYSAMRQDKWGDYVTRSFAIFCISVPSFWLATVVLVFPSIWWDYMPPLMLIRFAEDPIGNLKMFIVPALVLGMAMSGLTMRMTRTMMLEVLRQDYIRTAWSKGLREGVVISRHALKNALIPIVTVVGLQLPILIGGTVIIEKVFSLPGMGRLILDATMNRDYPLVSGVMAIYSIALVFINLAVDLTYGFLDPRVKYQ